MKVRTSRRNSDKPSPVCIHNISVYQSCTLCDEELNTPMLGLPLQTGAEGEEFHKSFFTVSHIVNCPKCGDEIPIFEELETFGDP